MKKIISLFALASALVLTSCAPSANFVFATDATWPPMEFVNDNKELVGFDIDMVKAIAKAAGFEVGFEVVSWDGIFAGLDGRQYNAIVSSVTINEERQASYDFSSSYLNAGQIMVVPIASTGITTLNDLVGRTVGAQIGTAGAFAVQSVAGINLKEYSEVGLAFNDMVNGNLEAVVCDTPVAADFALGNKAFAGKLKIVGEALTEENFGMVFRKVNLTEYTETVEAKKSEQQKHDEKTLELKALVEKGLAAIKADGTLEKLKAKWGLK